MYAYDLYLSEYNTVLSDLAEVFKIDEDLPFELRPKESAIVQCMEKKWSRDIVTDRQIEHIVERWASSRYLQDLYLDAAVSREFKLFHARFVVPLSLQARVADLDLFK